MSFSSILAEKYKLLYLCQMVPIKIYMIEIRCQNVYQSLRNKLLYTLLLCFTQKYPHILRKRRLKTGSIWATGWAVHTLKVTYLPTRQCYPFKTHWKIYLEWQEKKEEIWLSPVIKAPTTTEKSKKQRDNIKTLPTLRLHNDCGPTQYGQLSNSSHPTGVVKPVYVRTTFSLTATAV